MRDIGKNIKTIRIQKNMTQDELAQALFVTRQTVSNYETGRSRPDVDMLLRIAETLGVDANTVLYGLPIPEEKRRSYWSLGICAGITVLLGALVLWLRSIGAEASVYLRYAFPSYLARNWLQPAWLLLTGWTAMHALCLFFGTRILGTSASRYIKWGILALLTAYGILIMPHTLWFAWCDWQIWLQSRSGGVSFSSSFSVFPAWDWLALHATQIGPPRDAIQTVFAVLDFLPLLLGTILRLCGFPGRKQKSKTN